MKHIQWKGRRIGMPGIYAGIPIKKYHSATITKGVSISSGGLRKLFEGSPAHFWVSSYYNPNAIPITDTNDMRLGRAAHHLLLGEDNFRTLHVVRPPHWVDWKKENARAWRNERLKAGLEVLTPDDLEKIRGIARSLAQYPLIKRGMLNGAIERSLIWHDPVTGVWLKARPDAMPESDRVFTDLKLTRDVDYDSMVKRVREFRLDMQAALVRWLVREITKHDIESFHLLFVESKPPHTIGSVTFSPQQLDNAEKDLRVALRVFAHCYERKAWFGPNGTQADALGLHLPEWFDNRCKFRRENLERELKPAVPGKQSTRDYRI